MSARVLILLPCLLVGGTEMHTLALARALLGGGYEVTVCAFYEYEPLTVDAFDRAGVSVRLLGLNRGNRGGSIGQMLRLSKALARVIRDVRPDFAHVQYMTPGLAPLLIARWMRVKRVFATVHVTANHYGNRVWLPRYIAAPLCDAFLTVSQVAERSFFGDSRIFSETDSHQGHRHFTIPNCVDLETTDIVLASGRPNELAARLNIGSQPVLGIVGRVDRFKGHDFLLQAFARVRQSVPDAILLCVGAGTGDWPKQLLALASSLGLSQAVIWTGGMPQAMAFQHLMLMDVVAMPSRPGLEGFGLAAAEAMAFGKPVIASDVDGLTEVVGREGEGLLVPPGDINALADAICELLVDEPRRKQLGLAGRRRVERLYSMQTFAERHLSLYRMMGEVPA